MKLLRKYLSKEEIPYILMTAVLGSLCHFFYEWSGNSPIAALFCPVNESPWEHLKLLFFPFLIFSVLEALIHRRILFSERFFWCRFCGVLCGMAFILSAFYTYTGICGAHFLLADLAVYFSGVLAAFLTSAYFLGSRRKSIPDSSVVILCWTAVCICFFLFTCFPPSLPLFQMQ